MTSDNPTPTVPGLTRDEASKLLASGGPPAEYWTDDAHDAADAPAAQGAEGVARDAAIAAAVNAMPSDCTLIRTERLNALVARAKVAAELAVAARLALTEFEWLVHVGVVKGYELTRDTLTAALARAEAAGVTMGDTDGK